MAGQAPAWIRNETDVDTAVAALLDQADAIEAEARERGRPRSATAQVRKLRWLAKGLEQAGTGDPLPDPSPRRDPVAQ